MVNYCAITPNRVVIVQSSIIQVQIIYWALGIRNSKFNPSIQDTIPKPIFSVIPVNLFFPLKQFYVRADLPLAISEFLELHNL